MSGFTIADSIKTWLIHGYIERENEHAPPVRSLARSLLGYAKCKACFHRVKSLLAARSLSKLGNLHRGATVMLAMPAGCVDNNNIHPRCSSRKTRSIFHLEVVEN